MSRRDAALAVVAMLVAGCVAVAFGQTTGWDLRNYHLYSAWAWQNGRDAIDLAPAQLQGFYNPLFYVDVVWLVDHLPPWAVTFVSGALAGACVPLLAAIARRLMRSVDAGADPGRGPVAATKSERALPWIFAITGMLGATSLGELGATQGDNLLAVPVLAAILLVFRASTERASMLASGALFGAAVGLKLALAPIVAAFIVALPLLDRHARERFARFAWLAPAAALAFAVTAGPWMWRLYAQYGNPLFPFAESIFPSPFAIGFDATDARFRAGSLVDAYLAPFRWLADWRSASDLKFRDLRVAFLTLLLPLMLWRLLRGDERDDAQRRLLFFAAAFAITLPAWGLLFGYHRYLAAWEMLAPVVAGAYLWRISAKRRRDFAGIVAAMVVLALSTNPANWGRTTHGVRFVEVDLPAMLARPGTMVLFAGDAPLSYLVRELPRDTPAVRISANFFGPPYRRNAWDDAAAARIAAHGGPLVVVHQAKRRADISPALDRHTLKISGDCAIVATNLRPQDEPPVEACPVSRTG